MMYYITNTKPGKLLFEANEKGYGGREFIFSETLDRRWALVVDCIKYIEDKYQKEVIPCAKQLSVFEKLTANNIMSLMKTANIETDVKFKTEQIEP